MTLTSAPHCLRFDFLCPGSLSRARAPRERRDASTTPRHPAGTRTGHRTARRSPSPQLVRCLLRIKGTKDKAVYRRFYLNFEIAEAQAGQSLTGTFTLANSYFTRGAVTGGHGIVVRSAKT